MGRSAQTERHRAEDWRRWLIESSGSQVRTSPGSQLCPALKNISNSLPSSTSTFENKTSLFAGNPANSLEVMGFILHPSTYGVAKPLSVPDCGFPAPLSVKVIVPARVVPLAEPMLVNLTPTVQLAAGAKVVPVQLSPPIILL